MFKRNYFYLVAGLPDIILDQKKLGFSIAEFREDLRNQLNSEDDKLVEFLFLPADNQNLINLLVQSGKPFDESGNYTQDELEEGIKEPSSLPAYMQSFIIAYKSDSPLFEGLSWENQLTWLFYEYANKCSNEFLRNWFDFDLNLKNIVAGMIVRNHKLEGDKFFIGDSSIVQAVRKSTLKDFGLGNDFEYMERLINIQDNDNLLEREKAMDTMIWDFLDDQNTLNYFTIEVILAYIIKLQMVMRWFEMDYETGKEMFKKLLEDLEQSYEFPEEFALKDARRER